MSADNHRTHNRSPTRRSFDPATKKWEALPPLPETRSSHDVVVMGNKLIVMGGWGIDGDGTLAETIEILDLAKNRRGRAAQPFKRRALMAAAFEGKMYAIGGFDENNETRARGIGLRPATGAWSQGFKTPGGFFGFSVRRRGHEQWRALRQRFGRYVVPAYKDLRRLGASRRVHSGGSPISSPLPPPSYR